MPNRQRKAPANPTLHWMKAKTYEELKAMTSRFVIKRTPQENWAIMERMRQLRYGYKPDELKMDKTTIRIFEYMAAFREDTESEYQEEIKKYGPR